MEPKSIEYQYLDLFSTRTTGVIRTLSPGSSELYEDRDNVICEHCKLTGKHCIGHVGYYLLSGLHLNPLFSEEINNLKACICSQCRKPYPTMPKGCSQSRRTLHNKLVSYYINISPLNSREDDYVTCSCVEKAAIQKWDSFSLACYISETYAESLQKHLTSKAMINAGRKVEIFPEMFDYIGLSPGSKLLCKYVPVIPHKVISLMTEAKEVSNAYKSLEDMERSSGRAKDKGVENVQKALDNLFRCIFSTITGKEGVTRQFMVTVHAATSCRAVIVGDPSLPINRIRISKGVAKTLLREVEVTKDNCSSVVSWVEQKRVHQIMYKRDKYRILESKVYTACTLKSLQDESSFLYLLKEEDIILFKEGENIVTSKVSDIAKDLLVELLNNKSQVEVVVQGLPYSIVANSSANVVRCSDSSLPSGETMVPLMIGSSVYCVDDNGSLTVHRNPVMSADSIRLLKAQIDNTGPEVSLSTLEKHQQKREIMSTTYKTGAKGIVSSLAFNTLDPTAPKEKYVPIRDAKEPFGTVSGIKTLCKVVDISPSYNEDSLYQNNSKVLAINPVITPGYNADFDGDEMNVRVVSQSTTEDQEMSIVSDCLREKEGKATYGPQHDGRYGLWVFVNTKGTLQARIEQTVAEFEAEYAKWSDASHKDSHPIFRQLPSASKESYDSKRESNLVQMERAKRERLCNILAYWKTFNQDKCYGTMVDEFVASFFHYAGRDKSLLNNSVFNKSLYDHYKLLRVLDTFRLSYDVFTEDGFAKLYSNVCMALYNFCDAYGMCIDYEGEMAKEIVESGCRPSKGTYDTLYKSHGNVVFMLPGNRQFRVWVSGNCSDGFTKEEYEKMAYKTRGDLSTKARSAAPSGDAMRRWCTLLTGTKKSEDDVWSVKGLSFLKEPFKIRSVELDMLKFARTTHNFQRELDLSLTKFSFLEETELSKAMTEELGQGLHIGQRKLLMSEIEFLTRHLQTEDTIIYAGAAPGTHIRTLVTMFPDIHFHLYDCLEIRMPDSGNVTIYKELLTEEVVRSRYSDPEIQNKLLLISDIRSGEDYKEQKSKEEAVKKDNQLQLSLVTSMYPKACLLKFRCPFETGTTTMLEGRILPQCWTHRWSAESRLEALRPYKVIEIENDKYSSAMFSHNLARASLYDTEKNLPALKKDLQKRGCKLIYDYILEVTILESYCKRYEKDIVEVYKKIDEDFSCSISRSRK